MQRRGDEGGGSLRSSLTFNAAVKYGVPLSGGTTTATGDSFHSQNVSSSDPPDRPRHRPTGGPGESYDGCAAREHAGQSYISARLSLALLGERVEAGRKGEP